MRVVVLSMFMIRMHVLVRTVLAAMIMTVPRGPSSVLMIMSVLVSMVMAMFMRMRMRVRFIAVIMQMLMLMHVRMLMRVAMRMRVLVDFLKFHGEIPRGWKEKQGSIAIQSDHG